MKYLFVTISFFFLLSCTQDKRKMSDGCTDSGVYQIEDTINPSEKRFSNLIDTSSLKIFWNKFQEDVSVGNNQEVIDIVDFPVHAIIFVTFQFAYDCDTLQFMSNEELYLNFDIGQDNANEYYDFMFSDFMEEIIKSITFKDLINDGIIHKKSEGLTFQIFPKEYKKNNNCPMDHVINFRFNRKDDKWVLGIGGI